MTATLPVPPDATSRDRAWTRFCVDVHDWPGPGTVTSAAPDHDIVAMRISGSVRLVQRRDGIRDERVATVGNVTVHPRGVESSWSWDGPGAIVLMRLPQPFLEEAAAMAVRNDLLTPSLVSCFGVRDAFVEAVVNMLVAEMKEAEHPAQAMIAERLACALAAHVVHRFEARGGEPAGLGHLSPSALRCVIDFIESVRSEPVTLEQLARVARVSRFHFARAFKRSMGVSPMVYVETARLRHARALITNTALPIAQIALAVGYSDQSHFTRRFRRAFGRTPGELRRFRLV